MPVHGATTERERYDSAALVLWVLAAVNVFGGLVSMITAPDGSGGLVAVLGIVTVTTAVIFGGLAFFVRRGSQAAVVVAVILLGLVLAVRVVPLFAGGGLRFADVLSVLVTAAVLVIVGRALRT